MKIFHSSHALLIAALKQRHPLHYALGKHNKQQNISPTRHCDVSASDKSRTLGQQQMAEAGSRKQKTPGSDKDQNLNFSYFSQSPFISLSLFCLIINLKNEETRDTLLTRTQNIYLKIENWHNKMENKYAKSMEEYLNCKLIQRRMKNQ